MNDVRPCGWIDTALAGTYTLQQGYALQCGAPATELRFYGPDEMFYPFCPKHAEEFDSILSKEPR